MGGGTATGGLWSLASSAVCSFSLGPTGNESKRDIIMVVSRVFFAATASHRHFQNGFPGFPIHSVDSGPPEQGDLRRDVGQV